MLFIFLYDRRCYPFDAQFFTVYLYEPLQEAKQFYKVMPYDERRKVLAVQMIFEVTDGVLPGSCLAYEPQAGVVSGAEMASCLVFILT
jgi:hypothetical protein